MLRLITTRITSRFSSLTKIIKLPPTTNDISNTLGYLNTSSDAPTMSMFQKISHFSFPNMYDSLDLFSRDLLFTLANDYHLGLPVGVIAISFFIRLAFFYANVKGQVGAMKMQQMKPYMDAFQQKTRIAQMTRNFNMLKSARNQLKQEQKKKGIDNFYALINMAQIPFLITWFLSLRYVASLPQLFPSATQGFLWVSDLSAYDPYFILPIISACFTSYSIHISPTLKSKTVMPIFQPYVKYFKWFPFFSLPFTGFFPALVNLYWASIACNQALLMITMNSNYIPSKPQILQAVFVQEKPKLKSQQNTVNSQKQSFQNDLNPQTLQLLKTKPKKPKKSLK